MPTALDRATNQRGPFLAFAAIVTGVAAWSIWGQDIFPSSDPTGGMLLLFLSIGVCLCAMYPVSQALVWWLPMGVIVWALFGVNAGIKLVSIIVAAGLLFQLTFTVIFWNFNEDSK